MLKIICTFQGDTSTHSFFVDENKVFTHKMNMSPEELREILKNIAIRLAFEYGSTLTSGVYNIIRIEPREQNPDFTHIVSYATGAIEWNANKKINLKENLPKHAPSIKVEIIEDFKEGAANALARELSEHKKLLENTERVKAELALIDERVQKSPEYHETPHAPSPFFENYHYDEAPAFKDFGVDEKDFAAIKKAIRDRKEAVAKLDTELEALCSEVKEVRKDAASPSDEYDVTALSKYAEDCLEELQLENIAKAVKKTIAQEEERLAADYEAAFKAQIEIRHSIFGTARLSLVNINKLLAFSLYQAAVIYWNNFFKKTDFQNKSVVEQKKRSFEEKFGCIKIHVCDNGQLSSIDGVYNLFLGETPKTLNESAEIIRTLLTNCNKKYFFEADALDFVHKALNEFDVNCRKTIFNDTIKTPLITTYTGSYNPVQRFRDKTHFEWNKPATEVEEVVADIKSQHKKELSVGQQILGPIIEDLRSNEFIINAFQVAYDLIKDTFQRLSGKFGAVRSNSEETNLAKRKKPRVINLERPRLTQSCSEPEKKVDPIKKRIADKKVALIIAHAKSEAERIVAEGNLERRYTDVLALPLVYNDSSNNPLSHQLQLINEKYFELLSKEKSNIERLIAANITLKEETLRETDADIIKHIPGRMTGNLRCIRNSSDRMDTYRNILEKIGCDNSLNNNNVNCVQAVKDATIVHACIQDKSEALCAAFENLQAVNKSYQAALEVHLTLLKELEAQPETANYSDLVRIEQKILASQQKLKDNTVTVLDAATDYQRKAQVAAENQKAAKPATPPPVNKQESPHAERVVQENLENAKHVAICDLLMPLLKNIDFWHSKVVRYWGGDKVTVGEKSASVPKGIASIVKELNIYEHYKENALCAKSFVNLLKEKASEAKQRKEKGGSRYSFWNVRKDKLDVFYDYLANPMNDASFTALTQWIKEHGPKKASKKRCCC